ncbi:hypothetical protein HDU76_006863 [Blyttiomyces sp. JEL0837]|nr:hypothetical protein HDU76_006863 [Blyttiomyces sp. JEL0837]
MLRVRDIIQQQVDARRRARGNILDFEVKGPWKPNMAVANEYGNGNELTGAHADVLTYIGPRPIIASLSLGAGRIFRIKSIPRDGFPVKTFNINLPHNSLLIMFPPLQEEYKHEVPKQTFVTLHPLSGEARYNLTFRMYRKDYKNPPRCRCGEETATELKPVFKSDNVGRYYWYCVYGKPPKGCGFFKWWDPAEHEPHQSNA